MSRGTRSNNDVRLDYVFILMIRRQCTVHSQNMDTGQDWWADPQSTTIHKFPITVSIKGNST